ncbi:MAG: FHA domain-containing protein [Rhodoglobus sp.]
MPIPTPIEDLVEIVMPERDPAVFVRSESLDAAANHEADQPADEEVGEEHVDVQSSVEPVESDTCAQCGSALAPGDIFCGDCGFVRQASGAARPRDTVSLDPFPWGVPTGPDAVALREEPVPTFDDDIDETRIVDRTARGERFVLQFSTGDSVSVTGTGLLGRNPVAEPGEYVDSLVTISDPGKSVSKTHLEFGQDGGTFWISDRYSGNGTVVRQPEAQADGPPPDPARTDLLGRRERDGHGGQCRPMRYSDG